MDKGKVADNKVKETKTRSKEIGINSLESSSTHKQEKEPPLNNKTLIQDESGANLEMLSSTKNNHLDASSTSICPMVETMGKDETVSVSNCGNIDSVLSFEFKQGLDYGLESSNPFELLKHLNQNDSKGHNSIDGQTEMSAVSSASELTSSDSDDESPHISSLSKKIISEATPNKFLNNNSKKKSHKKGKKRNKND